MWGIMQVNTGEFGVLNQSEEHLWTHNALSLKATAAEDDTSCLAANSMKEWVHPVGISDSGSASWPQWTVSWPPCQKAGIISNCFHCTPMGSTVNRSRSSRCFHLRLTSRGLKGDSGRAWCGPWAVEWPQLFLQVTLWQIVGLYFGTYLGGHHCRLLTVGRFRAL